MIIPQAHVQFNGVHWYCLQPGDGTRYQFGFLDPIVASSWSSSNLVPTYTNKDETVYGNHPRVKADEPTASASVGNVFPGIGIAGEDYVIVIVDMPGRQGCHPVMKVSLKDVDKHIVNYYVSHTGGFLYPPTVCAVLLAVSVLMYNSANVVEAARKMLEWPNILYPKEEDNG